MKLVIDVANEDIDELKKKIMSVDEMQNTVEGRIFCEIVHSSLYQSSEKE